MAGSAGVKQMQCSDRRVIFPIQLENGVDMTKSWIGAVVLCLSISVCGATEPVSEWYLGLRGGEVLAGQDLPGDDGKIYAVDLTLIPSANRMYELEYFSDEVDFNSGLELKHRGLKLNWVEVNRAPLWNPYFLLGAGVIEYQVGGEKDTDLAVDVGVGGMWQLNNRGLMLRADARYRYGISGPDIAGEGNSGDVSLTIGIMLPFGVRL